MADQHPQTHKESKGFLNRMKKRVFGRGSQSTPPSRSNSPSPVTVVPPTDLPLTISTMTTDPQEAARLRSKYTHFRILVIGRANAGKTTLLQRVCNTNKDPVYSKINPTSKRGIHNVYDGFSFQSNPKFIFHDSPGFEAGGEQELNEVLSFLQEKAKANQVKDQIHAIWFCFAPDVSRPLLGLEQRFFNEQRAWNVPVVAIFTKFDDLITQVYDRNKEEEENRERACAILEKKFEKPLRGYKFPPRAYVRFESIHEDEGNHQKQVGELIKQTAASIDDLALKMLFVTVQQNNLEVCIEYAVNKYIFNSTSTVELLIYKAVSWFGHCYSQKHDYGKKEKKCTNIQYRGKYYEGGAYYARYRRAYAEGTERYNFLPNVLPIVNAHFNVPSLRSFIAILVCLEHSFWIVQQGSNLTDGFIKTWTIYLETQHAVVDREVDDYLKSKGSDDWFITKYSPSEEECVECRRIVFNNLLSRSKTST